MKKRKKKRTEPQPELVPPIGFGYMPLYCAAQWIATAGHSSPWNAVKASAWEGSYRDLCNAIASEEVKAIGVIEGIKNPVPAHLFQGCEVSHIGNLSFPTRDDDYYLASSPYIGTSRWEDRTWDMLVGRNGLPRWDRLHVRNQDVRRLWPFNLLDKFSICKLKPRTERSPTLVSAVKATYTRLWPDGACPPRKKERDEKIRAELGKHPPSERTIRRALSHLT